MIRTRLARALAAPLVALALFAAPALPLFAAPAAAQDFQKGAAAAEAGDFEAALREWRPLAEAGEAYAQANLAALYVRGQGVPADVGAALNWYRLAAAQGLSAAQFNIGQLLRSPGAGDLRDVDEATVWFERAASQGNAEAHYLLGLIHANGEAGPRDFARTQMHWKIAEALGSDSPARQLDSLKKLMSETQIAEANAAAGVWLDAFKARSTEVARLRADLSEADLQIEQLRGALAARDAEAAALRHRIVELDSAIEGLRGTVAARESTLQRQTAVAPSIAPISAATVSAAARPSTNDDGVAAYNDGDFARAFDIWFELATQGDARAQFHLGALYQEGRGTAHDPAEARHWLGIAAHQGSAPARELLETLKAPNGG